jgi:hypothetical protein
MEKAYTNSYCFSVPPLKWEVDDMFEYVSSKTLARNQRLARNDSVSPALAKAALMKHVEKCLVEVYDEDELRHLQELCRQVCFTINLLD